MNFQKDAYGALHNRQKRALYQNAQLKDEVVIQGIGIGNLNARLAKQKVLQDRVKEEMKVLHRTVSENAH